MHPAGQVVVSLPPTDRPALADPPTQLIFDYMTRASRTAKASRVRVVLLAVLGALVFAGLALSGFRLDGSAAMLLGCCALIVAAAVVNRIRFGWVRRVRTLLASEPWRPVPAQLVRGGPKSTRCVVRLTAGPAPLLLRIDRAQWAVQQTIGRTGRLWMVGPDVEGTAVVTVDACRGGLPAKVIGQLPPGEVPVLPAPSTTSSPLDDPVIASIAAWLPRMVGRLLAVSLLIVLLGVAALAALPSAGVGEGCVGGGVVLFGLFLWQLQYVRRLPSLLRAGPWMSLPVRLEPWPQQRRIVANVSGEVRLPDGTVAAVMLPRANISLFANATDSGVLWVAGEPAQGGTFAVGVPGHPVLGVARLR